ncbi:hypothetical protein HMN09_00289300 [Mycena chlorophos]|uniref:F-box domain-containing protein n=1 Tax=Mycena chlorophos TaxID=658473 RepID=A0A8H6WLU5_MYCCL|nr:hypothetical protein HMN09_00289300 [Mycena chlorophos]
MTFLSTSPAGRRFAPEILSEIFSHFSACHELVPASSTCQYWRDVALGDRRQWTRIEIGPCDAYPDYFEVVENMLSRSRGWPLEIIIKFDFDAAELEEFGAHARHLFQQILTPHFDHCTHLTISATTHSFISVIGVTDRTRPISQFSLLTSLELFNTDAPLDGEDATISEMCFCLPQVNRIKSIKLVGILVDGAAGVELKLPHLDRLEAAEYIPFFDSGAVETELFHEPKELILRSLYIPRIVPGLLGPPFEHPSRIERLHLSKITMYTHEPEHAENFFTVLDTSNVRTLILDALDSSSTIWSELVRAVKPSSAAAPPKFGRVTELTITNIAPLLVTCVCETRESVPCMDCFTGFFAAFPALTTFRVNQRYDSVSFNSGFPSWPCPAQEFIWTVPERVWVSITELFRRNPQTCPALRKIRAGRERLRIDSWRQELLERDWLEDFVFTRPEYQCSRSMDVEVDSADEHSVHTH